MNDKLDRVPLFASNGLREQLGTAGYSRDRYFGPKINAWLRLRAGCGRKPNSPIFSLSLFTPNSFVTSQD